MAKRTASQREADDKDEDEHADTKRPRDFLAVLFETGSEKYGEVLNFELGCTANKGRHLLVSCKVYHWHPPAGSISRKRLVVQEDNSFSFQVMFHCKESGILEIPEDFLSLCDMMVNADYKFCLGIDVEEYESKYFSKIRYDVKFLRRTEFPFRRIDSSSCQLLHKLAKNASVVEKVLECVPCKSCKQLMHTLDRRLKTAVSSPAKMKRQQSSSHCPLKYMSPSSQKRRKENTQRERAKDQSRLQKYSYTELTLDDEQHDELSKLMDAIDERGSEDIEVIMREADSHGVGNSFREIWEMDKQRMRDEFNEEQQKNCELMYYVT